MSVPARQMTKGELKLFVASNLKRKGITDGMMNRLIDVLWRPKYSMRTSGFSIAGGLDSVLTWDDTTRSLTLEPNPLSEDVSGSGGEYIRRFTFYTWTYRAHYNERMEAESIILPDEEGLYMVYYGPNPETNLYSLLYIKNPSEDEMYQIYTRYILVSFVYWNAADGQAETFGDDRHGSWVNPFMHWINHVTEYGKRHSGLLVEGLVLNGDGSSDDELNFSTSEGIFWHDDFKITVAAAGGSSQVPVLYWDNGKIRFSRSDLPIIVQGGAVCYNRNGFDVQAVSDGSFCLYHCFATNDKIEGNQVITIPGRYQYTSLSRAYENVSDELAEIRPEMPQKGQFYIGTFLLMADSAYTNSGAARIISIVNELKIHPPVTIAGGSEQYLQISDEQELSFSPDELISEVTEIVGDTITQEIDNSKTEIVEVINASIADGAYSKIVDTTLAAYTQESIWEVVDLRERMGEFKTTVIIHDLSNDNTYHLQSLLGFDYINSSAEVSVQSDLITDATVTLTLSVNASDVLQAALSGMPTNAKRIHFCFDRCVLGFDAAGLVGAGLLELTGEGEIKGYLNLEGNGLLQLLGEGGISGSENLEGAGLLELTGEGSLGSTMELSGEGLMELSGEGEWEAMYAGPGIFTLSGPDVGFSYTRAPLSAETGVFTLTGNLSNPVLENCTEYGALYNYHVLTDARGIVKSGWHIPTLSELITWMESYTGETIYDNLEAPKFKDGVDAHWSGTGSEGTNEYYFNGSAAGYRLPTGSYSNFGSSNNYGLNSGSWVSETWYWNRMWLMWNEDDVNFTSLTGENRGLSLRPVKDSTTLEHGEMAIFEGNDGRLYNTICIHGLEFIADAYQETRYNNGDPVPFVEAATAWAATTEGAMCAPNGVISNISCDFSANYVLSATQGTFTVSAPEVTLTYFSDPFAGYDLLATFYTNSGNTTTFDPVIAVNSGSFKWDLGDDTVVEGLTVSHTYDDSTTKTVKLYGKDTPQINTIGFNSDNIVGTLDLSNNAFSYGQSWQLSGNGSLTGVTLPSTQNSSYITGFAINDCNITGTLDLSVFTALRTTSSGVAFTLYNNANMTGVTFASSVTGLISRIWLYNAAVTSLDLSMFTGYTADGDLTVYGMSTLTSLTLPSSMTAGAMDDLNFSDNTSLTSVDISGFTDYTTSGEIDISNCALTSLSLPSSVTGTMQKIALFDNPISGTIDLSAYDTWSAAGVLWLYDMANVTGFTFASSITGTLQNLRLYNDSSISSLNLSMFDTLYATYTYIHLYNMTSLTSITWASNITGNCVNYYAYNSNGYFTDFSQFATLGNTNSASINIRDNAYTTAEVNEILVGLDSILTSGYSSRNIQIDGTNAAPDGSSGGFNGTAAVTSLEGKGITVYTS